MALAVRAKELFRTGLVQKVTRFVSPPNPSGQSSFLWKSDSFSAQKRAILMGRMVDYETSLFSSTQVATPPVAEIHTSPAREAAEAEEDVKTGAVTSAGTSSEETDTGLLDRDYGQEQADHHTIAERSHDHHISAANNEEEPESLESTGFDMSKMSRPSGDE